MEKITFNLWATAEAKIQDVRKGHPRLETSNIGQNVGGKNDTVSRQVPSSNQGSEKSVVRFRSNIECWEPGEPTHQAYNLSTFVKFPHHYHRHHCRV